MNILKSRKKVEIPSVSGVYAAKGMFESLEGITEDIMPGSNLLKKLKSLYDKKMHPYLRSGFDKLKERYWINSTRF